MSDEPPPGAEKSLLERLNALKPTSVSLSGSKSSVSPADTIERTKPPSREDVLSARLKNLRNQETESKSATPSSPGSEGHREKSAPPPPEREGTSSVTGGIPGGTKASPELLQDDESLDPLYTDDQTLEELLADLRADDSWLDGVAAEEELHQKTTAFLGELGKSVKRHEGTDSDAVKTGGGEGEGEGEGSSDDDDDDDSEGEVMTRETDAVLAKVRDELEWEKSTERPRSSGHASPAHEGIPPTQPGKPPAEQGSNNEAKPSSSSSPSQEKPFDLPTVPSELQDQPGVVEEDDAQPQSDTDFAASIASRMAALKLSSAPKRGARHESLPSAPTAAVDSLGLPAAPTFAPVYVSEATKRADAERDQMKTWCVVCLDDGAVRCLGCDAGDDVYCARCWKDMHIGPSAGFDERGHSWETFRAR